MFKLSNLFTLILVTFLYSCDQKQGTKTLRADTVATKQIDTTKMSSSNFADTIKIDYLQNKDILALLPLLPDSAMGSWEWNKDERIKTVDFIKTHHYFIDTTKLYNNIKTIKPHYFYTQVVDGSWSLSIYKIEDNHFIVITNDIVGDGNDLNVYEFNKSTLKSIDIKDVLGNYLQELLIDQHNDQCANTLEDNPVVFSYNFETRDIIEISSSYLSKKENSKCLKGNILKYKFNPALRKFECIAITWI